MIILFVLSGLIFLGGGIAAIVDGLPYLVLERGFTQVIVGTVLATSGVLLLALSRVLAELRRVRTTLSNAMMAVSVASMAGEPSDPTPGVAKSAAAAGIGLAAGAGAAVVATHMLADDDRAEKSDASDKPEAVDLDLFGQPAEAGASDQDADLHTGPDTVAEPEDAGEAASIAQQELALPGDMPNGLDRTPPAIEAAADDEKNWASEGVPASDDAPATVVAEAGDAISDSTDTAEDAPADPAVEPVARNAPWLGWMRAKREPKFEPVAEPQAEPEPESEPEADAAPPPAADKAPGDEFDFLRKRLSGSLAESEDNPSSDTSDERRAGSLGDAESWMASPSPRREPWFEDRETPAEPEEHAAESDVEPEAASDLQPPPWPPQTRDPVAAEPAAEAWEIDAEPETPPAEILPEPEPATPAGVEEPEPVSEAAPPAAEPAPPAASNEGIVGAYQVGDAHFTIFADGSIRARTPDGDYRFASMEELKTYLASEKSRLGV